MILKIVYTCINTGQEGCSCVLSDVDTVRFHPSGAVPYDVVYEFIEDELKPLVFNSCEKDKTTKDVIVAALHVTFKDGSEKMVFFDEDAYLCNENGKTIEHYNGRPRDGKKIRV